MRKATRKDASKKTESGKYTKRVIFPPQISITDFNTFVWLASTELAQDRVLYSEINGKKYLIAYGASREKQKINTGGLIVNDDINAIVIVKVDEFKKFIRFDLFDEAMLKYESKFDNKTTYKETTIFIRVEILPTETDALVIEHIKKTKKWTPVRFPA
jgi:hypothetical protein